MGRPMGRRIETSRRTFASLGLILLTRHVTRSPTAGSVARFRTRRPAIVGRRSPPQRKSVGAASSDAPSRVRLFADSLDVAMSDRRRVRVAFASVTNLYVTTSSFGVLTVQGASVQRRSTFISHDRDAAKQACSPLECE